MTIEFHCERSYIMFHGYLVYREGFVASKKNGKPLKTSLRERRGGGYDVCVLLYYNGKRKKWTLQRLMVACFLGPIDGYQINHLIEGINTKSYPSQG